MKRKLLILSLCTIVIIGNAQKTENTKVNKRKKFTIGIYGGPEYNLNAYKMTSEESFSYYKMNEGYSAGIELGYFITNKVRTRVKIGYNSSNYGINWISSETIKNTEVKLEALDVDINVDYTLYNKNKFHFFGSVGIVSESVQKESYKTFLTNGDDNTKNYNVLTNPQPTSIIGANISVIAQVNILKKLKFTLTPGYNYYFNKFDDTNNSAYQRLSANMGLEFSF